MKMADGFGKDETVSVTKRKRLTAFYKAVNLGDSQKGREQLPPGVRWAGLTSFRPFRPFRPFHREACRAFRLFLWVYLRPWPL